MMDAHDTNQPLNQGELEEEKKTVEVSEAITETPSEETTAEVQPEAAPKPATKEDVLNRLKELAQDAENANKQEIDNLKQSFYKLHNAELEAAKKQFTDNGGAEEDFVPEEDPVEVEFKRLMGVIKEKRSKLVAEQERQKEENLQVKLSIIEELKELVESGDDANKSYTEFKKLQQQWNETKLVPQGKVNELWKNYQLYVEKFYDLLKLNNEFREYDFKKNLEIKTHLCEAAEKLADEEDVVSAFHQLQKLHQEFRDTGPVAKELRDEIWNRFKAASTAVNRRHQLHFETLKEAEQHNLDQKTVICEIVEAIRTFPPCLRRLLQEKRRILQELKRRHEREFGKEKSALRKSGSLKRQYRLESNCRYPDETPKRVEDNRTGSQETFGRCLETFYHGL